MFTSHRLFKFILINIIFPWNLISQQILDTSALFTKNKNFDLVENTNHLKTNTSQKHLINDNGNVSPVKIAVISGFTVGASIWLHNFQRNAWWSGQRGLFHIQNDWEYAMSADKMGHFFDGAFIHKLYSGAFEWAGLSRTAAMWGGTLFSIAYMTDIEIEDGYAHDWGFSMGDELFNVMGAFYPVMQNVYPPLQELNFKWSYFPSEDMRSGKKQGAFLDDYDGQTMWLSIGIHHFLSEKTKKYWPDFLNIALGYGVKGHTDYTKRYQDFYIGFDLDWRRIIPGNSKFMLWMKDILNHFRFLPAPVLRIGTTGTRIVVNY
jgi:hypothetical protein